MIDELPTELTSFVKLDENGAAPSGTFTEEMPPEIVTSPAPDEQKKEPIVGDFTDVIPFAGYDPKVEFRVPTSDGKHNGSSDIGRIAARSGVSVEEVSKAALKSMAEQQQDN